ncbi:hypothetical protein ABE096_13220 [Robertmurraya massiliosenegalensis]|uniref:hypothetical protein n=1 Tax=Robertmurraya massiliosenegalensis TaxID=1287657 RepID=UPI003D2E3FAD
MKSSYKRLLKLDFEEKGSSPLLRLLLIANNFLTYDMCYLDPNGLLLGLTLLGSILIGIHIAVFIGMSLGAKKNWTMLWSTISLVVWTLVFGILTMLGFDFFVRN